MMNPRVVLPVAVALATVLAACQQAPKTATPPTPAEPVPASAPPAAASPPTASPSDLWKTPPPPQTPVPPQAQQQAQRIAMSAVGMLENGHEEQAKAELQRALATDPANRLASLLMRQIQEDPVAMLGKEHFIYTVKPNDSLSSIAKQFLQEIYLFYALARYNDIAVPRHLAGGQALRIPGKAPPPQAGGKPPARRDDSSPLPPPPVAPPPVAPPPPPAAPAPPPEPTPAELAMRDGEAADKAGDWARAIGHYSRAATLGVSGAAAKADATRKKAVHQYGANAERAFAREDLDGSIKFWELVLVVDPGNANARNKLERAKELKKKAEQIQVPSRPVSR